MTSYQVSIFVVVHCSVKAFHHVGKLKYDVYYAELKSLKVLNMGFNDISDAVLAHLKGETLNFQLHFITRHYLHSRSFLRSHTFLSFKSIVCRLDKFGELKFGFMYD